MQDCVIGVYFNYPSSQLIDQVVIPESYVALIEEDGQSLASANSSCFYWHIHVVLSSGSVSSISNNEVFVGKSLYICCS